LPQDFVLHSRPFTLHERTRRLKGFTLALSRPKSLSAPTRDNAIRHLPLRLAATTTAPACTPTDDRKPGLLNSLIGPVKSGHHRFFGFCATSPGVLRRLQRPVLRQPRHRPAYASRSVRHHPRYFALEKLRLDHLGVGRRFTPFIGGSMSA